MHATDRRLISEMVRMYKNVRRCLHTNITSQNSPVVTTIVNDDASSVIVEKDTHITLIGINRERIRNCIDAATSRELCSAIRQFEMDNSSPVGVLYGVGGSFCAGPDIIELTQREKCVEYFRQELTKTHLKKPLVCAINGFCLASGIELALLCDLRVMENTAVMGFFNRPFGMPLSSSGTMRLAKTIGYAKAMDLVLTGRRIGSAEALRIGLINRVVATGTAQGQAVTVAFSIAKFPQCSLKSDRLNLYTNTYETAGSLQLASEREYADIDRDVFTEMKEAFERFKKYKTDSWYIKRSTIPAWEQAEIDIENAVALRRKTERSK